MSDAIMSKIGIILSHKAKLLGTHRKVGNKKLKFVGTKSAETDVDRRFNFLCRISDKLACKSKNYTPSEVAEIQIIWDYGIETINTISRMICDKELKEGNEECSL